MELPAMRDLINRMLTRKQSTQRVDDMAAGAARAALDQRLNRMLVQHANQPAPQARQFDALKDPRTE
jgi:type IV secretory pathway ATPase VirB11/archaellum biosynthesis ATPase